MHFIHLAVTHIHPRKAHSNAFIRSECLVLFLKSLFRFDICAEKDTIYIYTLNFHQVRTHLTSIQFKKPREHELCALGLITSAC